MSYKLVTLIHLKFFFFPFFFSRLEKVESKGINLLSNFNGIFHSFLRLCYLSLRLRKRILKIFFFLRYYYFNGLIK